MDKIYIKLASMTMSQILVIGLGLGAFYYFTLYNDGSSLVARIDQLNVELAKQQETKQKTDATLKDELSFKNKIGDLANQVNTLSKQVPPSLTTGDVQTQISNAMVSSQVLSENFNFSNQVGTPIGANTGAVFDEVPVKISTQQYSFPELTRFLNKLTETETVIRIKKIRIENEKYNTNTWLKDYRHLSFEAIIVGYRLIESKNNGTKSEVGQ